MTTSIVLGVRRSPSKAAAAAHQKPSFSMKDWPAVREQVLKRDRYSCSYCGFTAKKYQRVHYKNGVPAALRPEHLTTSCIFCEQCFELESIAKTHGGILIWLPEITQIELHHLCRALFVARLHDDHALAQKAQSCLEQLIARRTDAKKRIGTDDPVVLATMLLEQTDDRAYGERGAKLEGIRLLPLARRLQAVAGQAEDAPDNDIFPDILRYWTGADGPFAKVTPHSMIALAEKLSA